MKRAKNVTKDSLRRNNLQRANIVFWASIKMKMRKKNVARVAEKRIFRAKWPFGFAHRRTESNAATSNFRGREGWAKSPGISNPVLRVDAALNRFIVCITDESEPLWQTVLDHFPRENNHGLREPLRSAQADVMIAAVRALSGRELCELASQAGVAIGEVGPPQDDDAPEGGAFYLNLSCHVTTI